MRKITTIASALLLCLSFSCQKEGNSSAVSKSSSAIKTPHLTTDATTTFANGADVSWVTQMESSGLKFYNSSGTQQDLFTILKGLGINSIRLRAWVNPSSGWCNTADVVAKAIRAKNAGMSIMIDFHYSDTWADPGDQNKPAAWASLSFTDLMTTAYNYTYNTLNTLKSNGITPTWVQVGNETSDGMLWQDGRASVNMKNFAWLVNCGYNATKAIFPSAKVIVHLANGYDNTTYRWLFDGLKANGASWDVIGMSLYPSTSNWSTLNSECLTNMNDMVSRYGKQVMICEAGMSESAATTCKSFLSDLITKVKSVSGGNGLGVFYWEPEAYNNWQGYGMGAFDPTGKPTVALTAF
jgi:arabinogalactan endo-1,4-beta-galactosidase